MTFRITLVTLILFCGCKPRAPVSSDLQNQAEPEFLSVTECREKFRGELTEIYEEAKTRETAPDGSGRLWVNDMTLGEYFDLEKLTLYGENLKGQGNYFDLDFQILLCMPNLKNIYLYNFTFDNPVYLQSLRKVEHVSIGDARMTKSQARALGAFLPIEIVSLDFNDWQITDLTPQDSMELAFLVKMINLKTIGLRDMQQIGDLSSIANLPQLVSIYVDNLQDGDLTPFSNKSSLESIDLRWGGNFDTSTLRNLPKLKKLTLKHTLTQSLDLNDLPALTRITLSDNCIASVKTQKTPSLTAFSMWRNPFLNRMDKVSLDGRLESFSIVNGVLHSLEGIEKIPFAPSIYSIEFDSPIDDLRPLEALQNHKIGILYLGGTQARHEPQGLQVEQYTGPRDGTRMFEAPPLGGEDAAIANLPPPYLDNFERCRVANNLP